MSVLLTRAFLLAEEIHATQQRKASIRPGIPYMGHLLEVAGTVMICGGPEVAVAAALLHDAIEDQGAGTRVAIGNQLGSEVLALVEEPGAPERRESEPNHTKRPTRTAKDHVCLRLQRWDATHARG